MNARIKLNSSLLVVTTLAASSLAAAPSRASDSATRDFIVSSERQTSTFVDATATNMPSEGHLHTTDSTFVDVDHDGDLDVAVSIEQESNRLYLNDGKGTLTYKQGAFGTAIRDSEHVRHADFDGDGNQDIIFVAESNETHQLFMGDGKGGFAEARERLTAGSQGNGLAVGDVNGDNLPDIFIGSTGEIGYGPTMKLRSARNLLFLNDYANPGHFINATQTHLPERDDQTEGVALADMDGDGDLDVVLASPAHDNRLLINDGNGYFNDESSRLDLTVPMETREVHILDVNNDRLLDIVFFNITSNNLGWDKDPQARLLVNNGIGRFVDETEQRLPVHSFSSWGGSVVDFNDDGSPDLLISAIEVPGFAALQVRAWQNDGTGKFADVTKIVVPSVTVGRGWSIGKGDLDGDGKDDVVVGGWGTQARLLLSDVKGYNSSLREQGIQPGR